MNNKVSAICRSLRLTLVAAILLSVLRVAAAPADSPAATAKAEAPAKLPAAADVIAKFVTTIGGKEAFSKIDSQHAKGKFEMPAQGIAGDLEVFHKRPNKLCVKITIPAIGDIRMGFNGKVGWSVNAATGPMLLEGKQLEQFQDEADFNSVLHLADNFKSMETVAVAQFDNKECYKLKLVKKSGNEVTEYYDTKTALLVGAIMTQESPLGPVTVTNVLAEYKKFNDVLFATQVTQKMGPIEQKMTVSSYEMNAVKEAEFDLPEPIKPLLKKP